MKILVTSFTYAPNRDGVQFVTQYLCEGLAIHGNDVTVITENNQDLPEHEVINGVTVERWPIYTHHLRHYGPREHYIHRIIDQQNQYDVLINVGTQTALTDWLLPHLREIHKPKILHIHSIWDFRIYAWDYTSLSSLIRKLVTNFRWAIYYAAHRHDFKQYAQVLQLYPQDYSVKDFKKWYGIKSSILENAAQDTFHIGAPIPQSQRLKNIVYVANFNQLKNQEGLVRAYLKASLSQEWSLDLVGSKPTQYLDRIKDVERKLRTQLNIPNNVHPIQYHLGMPREQIANLVKHSSLFAMSSLREAFSISLIEAMSSGVPWLSFDTGVARYLPGGIVVHDINDLSKKLSRLASSPDTRNQLGIDGYRYAAEHFRIEDKVNQLEDILKQIAKEERHD